MNKNILRGIIVEDYRLKKDRKLVLHKMNKNGVDIYYHYIPARKIKKTLLNDINAGEYLKENINDFKWYKSFRTYKKIYNCNDLISIINK